MIKKVTIKNYKSIQSTTIKLNELTVITGYNGSGKSSFIETLQFIQNTVLYGLTDNSQKQLNYSHNTLNNKNDIEFTIECKLNKHYYTYKLAVNKQNGNKYIITNELLTINNEIIIATKQKNTTLLSKSKKPLAVDFHNYISSWHFLNLEPKQITQHLKNKPELVKNKLQLLQNNEYNNKNLQLLPTGTLRLLYTLTALDNEKTTTLFIEEVENGLDPLSLNLLLCEIRNTLPKKQFIITTHSPYFLDLLDLKHIITTERKKQKTIFHYTNKKNIKKWNETFSIGTLYTMNILTKTS
jgi:predicted ATPase